MVCWDGDERPRSECGLPHGVQGLRWVFPSFSPFSGRCERTRFPDQGVPRPLEFVCTERVAGEEVTITYTRRTSVKRGLAYIASTYPDIDPARSERGELVTFRAPSGGGYRLTRVFQRYPFSVEIVASTKSLRERALTKTVETRRVSQISVR